MAKPDTSKPEYDDAQGVGAAGSISGSGRSGGNLARDISTREELERAAEGSAGATHVKGMNRKRASGGQPGAGRPNAGIQAGGTSDGAGGPSQLAHGTWILVADSEKALFFENVGDADFPVFEVVRKEEQENPPTREQGANRPGRFHDGPSAHRSAVDDADWHELAKERFAHDLAGILYRMAHRHQFDRMVLVAAPGVLGELRKMLHKEIEERVVAEVAKNLTNQPVDEIERHVKAELVRNE